MDIYRDVYLLHPEFSRQVRGLAQDLILSYETRRTKTRFEVFETFRHPARQKDLFKRGTTKATEYQSAHQFGLACDFVPVLTDEEAAELGRRIGERVFAGWNWHSSHDYAFLKDTAKKWALEVPITWDPCHVEHPHFRQALRTFNVALASA